MLTRSPPKILKTIPRSRFLTQATATLRTSPHLTQQVQCTVEGAPYYSVVVPKRVGCVLAGRDLSSKIAKMDLIFYGGCHFARDKNPQSASLTLSQEAALLIDRFDGEDVWALLFFCGETDSSGITLKGTDGEEMWAYTAHGAKVFSKALQDMK